MIIIKINFDLPFFWPLFGLLVDNLVLITGVFVELGPTPRMRIFGIAIFEMEEVGVSASSSSLSSLFKLGFLLILDFDGSRVGEGELPSGFLRRFSSDIAEVVLVLLVSYKQNLFF